MASTYQLIPPSCVVSATARRVYSACAVIGPAFALLLLAQAAFGISLLPRGLPDVFYDLLATIGSLAIALLIIGMECFLFLYDDSRAWKQMLWCFGNLVAPFGTALYCFVVYRRKTPMTAGQIARAASG